jgi:hypothetical protein
MSLSFPSRHHRSFDDGHNGSENGVPNFLLPFPLTFERSRFVTSGGVTFCTLHRTFASRCGCLDGLKEAKLVSEKPRLPLLRCHRCFHLTDTLVEFAVPWSVAFVEGAIDLLDKGVCVDCYGDLVRRTVRALMHHRCPFAFVRPAPLWDFPAWSKIPQKSVG